MSRPTMLFSRMMPRRFALIVVSAIGIILFTTLLPSYFHRSSHVTVMRLRECRSRDDFEELPADDSDVTKLEHSTEHNVPTEPIHLPTTNTAEVSTTTTKTCHSPYSKIFFLKTHKTGSSTITNILNRYTETHNLTMCLPRGMMYSFRWPHTLSLRYVQHRSGDVFANHARYSRNVSEELFPRNETFYFSILRHPVHQWESMFQFYHLKRSYQIQSEGSGITEFLDDPPHPLDVCKKLCLAKNPTAFDFGLDHKDEGNETLISELIEMLDEDFNLVLIMEHFDESLVLLKRRLCLDFRDIIYLKMNARLTSEARAPLTDEDVERLRQWNSIDVYIYEHFKEKFMKEIEQEGPEFYDDVAEFKSHLNYYKENCIAGETRVIAYGRRKVAGFKLKSNLSADLSLMCQQMTRQELPYVDVFRRQFVRKAAARLYSLHKQVKQINNLVSGIDVRKFT